MPRPARARLVLIISAASLCAALAWGGWKLWESGATEGTRAWEEGRVVALSLATGVTESGGKPVTTAEPSGEEKKHEEKPASAQQEPETATSAEASTETGLDPLVENTPEGPLPVIGKDGTRPWQRYARPFNRSGQAPMIVVVVTGIGQSQSVSEQALALPADISLSFSPYADNPTVWVNAARAKGHEALIDLPMEPEGFPANDPGPLALLSINTPEENAHRLRQVIAKAGNVIGLYMPPDEMFTIQAMQTKAMAEQLTPRGLLLFSAPPTKKTSLPEVIKGDSLPTIVADIRLDAEISAEAIEKQMQSAESIAMKRGYAIAVTQASALSLKIIAKWAEGLASRGYQLTPLSFIQSSGVKEQPH